MNRLETINTLPIEIAQLLGNDIQLQQLLTEDDNRLSKENFQKLNLNDLLKNEYISFTPVIDNNITNNSRNTFLIINLEEINFENRNDNASITGAIFVGTDKQHALLSENRLRLLEIILRIYNLLDNYKFSISGVVNINYATFVSFSEYVFGYKIVFNVTEQEVRKAEI